MVAGSIANAAPVLAEEKKEEAPILLNYSANELPTLEARLRSLTVAQASQDKQGTIEEKRIESPRNWSILIGHSYARPGLKEANRDVHAIENQIRQIAPGVKRFEDWSDIYKGTVGLGVSRNIELFGIRSRLELFGAYGAGAIETNQNNMQTVLGAPMNLRFKQTYNFKELDLGIFPRIAQWKGFTLEAGGYLTLGYLIAKTDLKTGIPLAQSTRVVKGKFSEPALGAAAVLSISYEILPGFELMVAPRYNWQKFTGPTKITDVTTSPYGTQVLRYSQDTVSDMSGFSVFGGIKINLW